MQLAAGRRQRTCAPRGSAPRAGGTSTASTIMQILYTALYEEAQCRHYAHTCDTTGSNARPRAATQRHAVRNTAAGAHPRTPRSTGATGTQAQCRACVGTTTWRHLALTVMIDNQNDSCDRTTTSVAPGAITVASPVRVASVSSKAGAAGHALCEHTDTRTQST